MAIQDQKHKAILFTLRLLDEKVSSRRHSYTNRQLYMQDFRSRWQKAESHHQALKQGQRNHERVGFQGAAAMITESHLIEGAIANLSSGGVYILGTKEGFQVKQEVRLKITPEGQSVTLKSTATVVRIEKLPSGYTGYALQFKTV